MSEKSKEARIPATIMMVDCAAGNFFESIPWEFRRAAKKNVEASGEGVTLAFQTTQGGRIWVSFETENSKTNPSLQLSFTCRPAELRALCTMFSDVSQHARELIRMSKRRS